MFEFTELDYQQTPLGDISLRRRAEPRLDGKIIYEVKLGDEFLMSSLFVEAEVQLAKLGLAALAKAGHVLSLDVVVGGLGLGHTAAAVLEDSSVESLTVIDVMEAVISWHVRGIVPLGETLTSDERCKLVQADFFAAAMSENGFVEAEHARLVHAILLDIDHSPSHWLNPGNSSFYSPKGLQSISDKLLEGGVFGLWSNNPPDDGFTCLMKTVFDSCESYVVGFENPYTNSKSSNTVYIAQKTAF